MRKNFLSFLTAIFAIALVLSALTNAEASRQRLGGMGMTDADSQLFIEKDTITTTLNPAALIGFPSLVGINKHATDATKDNASLFWKVSDTMIFHFLTSVASSVNLYGAFGISSDTTVGFNVQYTTSVDTAISKDLQTYSFTLGLLQKIGSDSLDFAATWAFEDGHADATDNYKPDNIGAITVLARYNMAISEAQKLHIILKGVYDDSMMTKAYANTTPKTDLSLKTGYVGISDEVKLSEAALAYVGLYNKYFKYNAPNNYGFTIDRAAIHFGVEGKVSDIFKARIGASKNLYNYQSFDGATSKINVAGTTINSNLTNRASGASTLLGDAPAAIAAPNNTLNAGLTARIGQLQIDWNLTMAFLADGPYFISGKTSTAGISTDVNVAYLFDTPVIK